MKQFEKFIARELYCSKCKQTTPTREKILLILPTGNLYQLLCSVCGTSVGTREETGGDSSSNFQMVK